MQFQYKKIAELTGLKINHVKQVIKGNRKAKLIDKFAIAHAINNLSILDFKNKLINK